MHYPVDQKNTTLPKDLLASNVTDIFVETGTNTGCGTKLAIECGFEKIITIDIEEKYVILARKRFAGNDNVQCLHGDSSIILASVIEQNLDKTMTFWLDGHGGMGGVPLMSELEIISKSPIKNHIIMIDDVRMFSSKQWKNLDFNFSLEEIKQKIVDINKDYKISFIDSVSGKGDILLAKVENLDD